MADLELEKLGRYEIVRELGRGAMGVVYEGYDPVVGRRVAVKTARRDVIDGSTRADELMERFLREARAAGVLSHPNIVTIYDAGEENGVAYIAMEYLDGTDLQKLLEHNKRFPVERVLEITSTICAALSHAHANGIVHRDIKPANVVVLSSGLIKVADFGIAHVSDSQLTQEGAVIGTPHYMSPEQFMGHAIDERSDLFSAGVIVYEMLTGEKPFHGNSLSAVMHSVLHVLPVSPHQLNFAVSDCLSRVVMKALSKDVRARYQTADDMCRALKECLKECPDPAVLQVDLPETALVMGETIRSDGGSATLLSGASEAATQVLDTPPAQSLHFDSAHEAGLFLREQRVQSGKTLGQILLDSRLPKRHLVALEDGSLLPFKGHEWEHIADSIRALCAVIGIGDPAPYLDAFELEYTATLKPKAVKKSRRAFLVGAAGPVVLAVAGWGAFTTLTNRTAPPVANVTLPVAEFLGQGDLPANDDYYQSFDLAFTMLKDLDDYAAGEVTAELRAVRPGREEAVVISKRLTDSGCLVIYDPSLKEAKLYTYKTGFEMSVKDLTLRAPDQQTLRDSQRIDVEFTQPAQ